MTKRKVLSIIFIIGAIAVFAVYLFLNQGDDQLKDLNSNKTPAYKKTEITPAFSPTIAKKNSTDNNPYILHEDIFATMFWVGEKATDANEYIPNESSAWDKNWLEHFGGIDNPYLRNGFYPSDFVPKENPFYAALPYSDFDEYGKKGNTGFIPWQNSLEASSLKNRWIKIFYKGNVCFAQWEDVGPFETDDFEYVFLGKRPKNPKAGIDISPAVRTCLKMAVNDYVSWQFADDDKVPDGPWKEIITDSDLNW